MVDALLVLAGDAELARVAALAGRQDHLLRVVLRLVGLDREGAVRPAVEVDERLLGPHVESVVAHDLVPALDQVLLACAVEPELPLRRLGVGLGVDPLALREVLDRVGDRSLLEDDERVPFLLRGERRVEAGGARADDHEVEGVALGARAHLGQLGDVVDDLDRLRHRQLDDRCAGEVADDVEPLDVRLVAAAERRAPVVGAAAGEDLLEGVADQSSGLLGRRAVAGGSDLRGLRLDRGF